jgi:hypothetical protein
VEEDDASDFKVAADVVDELVVVDCSALRVKVVVEGA